MSKTVRQPLAAALVALALLLTLAPPAGAEEAVGPLPTPEDFVTQQYEDFLSRSPDTTGLNYWTAQLEAGADPATLVESLALSEEFAGTIAPVVRLYYAHFQRPPDHAGLDYWASVARNGASLAGISEEFVNSEEFEATYGSLNDAQYVDLVYTNVLERPADDAGTAYWTNLLANGMSRGALLAAFSESEEYQTKMDGTVRATMLYVGMLKRAPESDGLDYWADTLDGGARYRDVIAGFLGAAEYDDRIEGIYPHVNPLTGVPTRTFPLRPALAVKIDNVDAARPQSNIEHADVIYEEMVEGNLTRLVAMFHSTLPATVGPVRSIRTTDIDILDQLNTPLLAASGANSGVLAAVAGADLVNVNALVVGGAYYRDGSRRAPHNLYADTHALYLGAPSQGGVPTALFDYRRPHTTPTGGVAATGVSVAFGRADIDFTWSPTAKGWVRSQNGSTHTTAAGRALAPANVVVLEVPYGVSAADANSPEAHTVGTGTAHVFTAGRRVTGTWTRGDSSDPIRILDANGDDIALTRGQTFVELAPPGSITLR
ncbi:MAG: DUF4214 domain-containing protein [Actinomycetota bacterium]